MLHLYWITEHRYNSNFLAGFSDKVKETWGKGVEKAKEGFQKAEDAFSEAKEKVSIDSL